MAPGEHKLCYNMMMILHDLHYHDEPCSIDLGGIFFIVACRFLEGLKLGIRAHQLDPVLYGLSVQIPNFNPFPPLQFDDNTPPFLSVDVPYKMDVALHCGAVSGIEI